MIDMTGNVQKRRKTYLQKKANKNKSKYQKKLKSILKFKVSKNII